jgi:hypothetical protein
MRKRLSLLSVLLVLVSPRSGAADEDAKAARATLDRAIKAMGGPKLLAARALSGSSRGTIFVLGNKSPVTNEWTVQGLDQLKWVTEVTLNDNPAAITLVVDRDKGWIKGNDNPSNPLPKEQLPALLQGFAALRLTETLLPLTEKVWKLSSLGEIKVNDKPALGVKAAKKGMPDLDVYFDKETALPVRAEMRIKEPSGMEVAYVAHFGGYKKIDGRMHFTRLTVRRDDMVVLEMERSDMKAKDKVDDATFAKP